MKHKKYIKTELYELIDAGKTLDQIGRHYGVTRQRMYQVFQALGIPTLEQRRKKFIAANFDTKKEWVWLSLCKKIPKLKSLRLRVLESMGELPTICPVLGLELDYACILGEKTFKSPFLDLLDYSKGYVPGNVFIVSNRAGRLRADGTPEEHRQIYEYYSSLES